MLGSHVRERFWEGDKVFMLSPFPPFRSPLPTLPLKSTLSWLVNKAHHATRDANVPRIGHSSPGLEATGPPRFTSVAVYLARGWAPTLFPGLARGSKASEYRERRSMCCAWNKCPVVGSSRCDVTSRPGHHVMPVSLVDCFRGACEGVSMHVEPLVSAREGDKLEGFPGRRENRALYRTLVNKLTHKTGRRIKSQSIERHSKVRAREDEEQGEQGERRWRDRHTLRERERERERARETWRGPHSNTDWLKRCDW